MLFMSALPWRVWAEQTSPSVPETGNMAEADKTASAEVSAENIATAAPAEEEDSYIPEDSELIFETIIQKYIEDDYMYAYNDGGTVYLSLAQLASFIGLMYENNNGIVTSYYSNNKAGVYTINLNKMTANAGSRDVEMSAKDYKSLDNTMFFSTDFLSRLYGIEIKYNFYDMKISIDRELEFPTMVKRNANKKRKNSRAFEFADKSFKDYEFDKRWFGMPVVDLTLGKGWGHYPKGRTTNSDNYAINIATIAGGLDINSYISGNSYDNHKPQVRLYGGRTLLEEPPNKINLKQFRIGDINGISSTYFAASSYGRGVTASSFKDLVMSADKTIDIVGPLREGWEVELYWNGQLVGYRQNSIAGEYNFPNIPVSYGLNTFKLVFYGPYGEKYEEEKRYYSGTSPVRKGEVGYNVAAYQPWRYLVEQNEPNKYEGKDIAVLDTAFYYGLSDDITLMGGVTQTPDAETRTKTQHFDMVGAQYALSGSSVQYNLEHNTDTSKVGHHFEWQGDVYYGTIYAMYDKYNGLHSPLSYYGNEYLKTKTEIRYSGSVWNIPYFASYRTGKKEEGDKPYENITGRVSKNITNHWYASLEDDYDSISHENEIRPSVYTYWDNYSLNTDLTYRSNPDPDFIDFSTKLTWRQDRYTYYTAGYRRDIQERMDFYTISGSRIFDFGGLSLSMSVDKRGNFSTYLSYNISFSKEPDKWNMLTSANSKLSNSGSIYATFHDDDGNPLEGVGVTANNMVNEQYTNEDGAVFITDLMANEKTILNVDMETLEDVSLKPDMETKKLVLRPGTLKEVDFEFKHYGSVEGQIANPYGKRLYGYKVAAVNDKGEELAATFSDLEGYFIIPDVPYGTVNVVISKDNRELAKLSGIKVDDLDIMLENEIETVDSMTPPEDYGMPDFESEEDTNVNAGENFYDAENNIAPEELQLPEDYDEEEEIRRINEQAHQKAIENMINEETANKVRDNNITSDVEESLNHAKEPKTSEKSENTAQRKI